MNTRWVIQNVEPKSMYDGQFYAGSNFLDSRWTSDIDKARAFMSKQAAHAERMYTFLKFYDVEIVERAWPDVAPTLTFPNPVKISSADSNLSKKIEVPATIAVLSELSSERERQKQKWAGIFDDDQYTAMDWHELISDYNAWARRMHSMGSLDKARRRYLQVAALAVAAVEALDRKITKSAMTKKEDAI